MEVFNLCSSSFECFAAGSAVAGAVVAVFAFLWGVWRGIYAFVRKNALKANSEAFCHVCGEQNKLTEVYDVELSVNGYKVSLSVVDCGNCEAETFHVYRVDEDFIAGGLDDLPF